MKYSIVNFLLRHFGRLPNNFFMCCLVAGVGFLRESNFTISSPAFLLSAGCSTNVTFLGFFGITLGFEVGLTKDFTVSIIPSQYMCFICIFSQFWILFFF